MQEIKNISFDEAIIEWQVKQSNAEYVPTDYTQGQWFLLTTGF